MGHSWGGFSTLNISALHPEISHIVVLSGFVSVEEMMKTFFSGILKGYRKPVLALEKETNPYFYGFNGITTLSNSKVKGLLIYSDNDKLCRISHYHLLKQALGERENLRFLLVKNKGHNPNYTVDAIGLLDKFSKERAKLIKKKNISKEEKDRFISSFDWDKMTQQDGEVWNEIFAHLDDKNG
jgi:dipeptidyl aminopeptidase/acylaminoacyl peptidase